MQLKDKKVLRVKPFFHSITTRIIISILLLILPVNFIIIFTTENYRDAVKQQTLSSCEVILNLYMSQLDKEMYSIDTYSYNLLDKADFIRVSEQRGNSKYILAKNSIYRDFTENMYFHYLPVGYFIYAPKLDDMTVAVSSTKNAKRSEIIEHLKDTETLDGFLRWRVLEIKGSRYLLHVYKVDGIYYGGFIFLDDIVQDIYNELDYTYKEIVIDDKNAAITSGNLTLMVKSQNQKLYLHLIINENEIFKKLPLPKRIMLVLAFVSLIIIPILYYLLQRMLIRPLKHIDRALRRLENGEKNYRIGKHNYAMEFLHINQSFNDMADQIESLKIENLEQELLKNKMELQNLQLQVRPHFLLNTFNTMFNMAQIKDYSGIQKMTLYLSQYFRYLFRSGRVTQKLRNELDVVKAYMEVAELRYKNCFVITYQIEEDVLDIELPPLIIHGFIENIIKYAVQVDKTILITIKSETTPEWIKIIIEDNGPGIHQTILDSIKSGEPVVKDDGKHIGIWNSRYRLKTFCSSEADIEVYSEWGKGTKVIIKLPWTGGLVDDITDR